MQPRLILVHGNSLSARSWHPLLADTALRQFSPTAIDLPGHGEAQRNTADRPYTLDGFMDQVVRSAKDNGPVVLVGHSLGGHVCARALAHIPNVKGLIIFGAPLLRNAGDAARAYIPVPALAKAYDPGLTRADAEQLAEAFTWPGSPEIASMADDILATDPRVRADIGAYLAAGQLPNEVAMVRNAGVPTCILHGADDPFIRTTYLDELAEELKAGAVAVVAKAGHSPQLQQPVAVASAIARFLRELPTA